MLREVWPFVDTHRQAGRPVVHLDWDEKGVRAEACGRSACLQGIDHAGMTLRGRCSRGCCPGRRRGRRGSRRSSHPVRSLPRRAPRGAVWVNRRSPQPCGETKGDRARRALPSYVAFRSEWQPVGSRPKLKPAVRDQEITHPRAFRSLGRAFPGGRGQRTGHGWPGCRSVFKEVARWSSLPRSI